MICNQKGFTLVELAITVALIALITLGVIKGLSLIENTKINNLIKEMEHYERIVSLYTLSHRKVPGLSGGNGYISQSQFWKELRAEGLIDGDPNDGRSPIHVFGDETKDRYAYGKPSKDIFVVSQISKGKRRPMLFCAKNIKNSYARGVDKKIDDGDPTYLSGHVYFGDSAGYNKDQPFVTLCKEFIVSHKVGG